MKRIYMDYAASTPVAPEVERAMRPYFGEIYGNLSSIHREGQEASAAVFLARQKIAKLLGCDYKEIIFTGSATEANNLALRGVMQAISDKRQVNSNGKIESGIKLYPIPYTLNPRIIISTIEHESVAETCRDLERGGVEVVRIPVSREGIIDLKKFKSALNERTVLVSIIYANNEIGTIQPIREIAEIINRFRHENNVAMSLRVRQLAEKQSYNNVRLPRLAEPRLAMTSGVVYPLFHTDAAQAFQYLPCKPEDLGVDLMTISAHKIYGPKGVGAFYIRNQKSNIKNQNDRLEFKYLNMESLNPIVTGADQEWGLRAGTENVPCIVGFGEAVESAEKRRYKEVARVKKLRDYFWNKLKLVEGKCPLSPPIGGDSGHFVELNGSLENRLPNNLNIYFPKRNAHDFLVALDMQGVAASAGSACRARIAAPSPVILAMGYSEERATASLRFSLGRGTTKEEIDRTVGIIKKLC